MRARVGIAALAALLALAAPSARAEESDLSHIDRMPTVNRGLFWIHDRIDRWLFEPLAVGWEFVTPETARTHLDQFFRNLYFPLRFTNHLLQGSTIQAGNELTRFTTNVLFGLGGFFDPAGAVGIPMRHADFGMTFGVWGIGEGSYLVIPILGPSTVRDGIGGIPELAVGLFVPGLGAVDGLNQRALALEDIRQIRGASLDYYAALRNGYLQQRRALIRGEHPDGAPSDQLYDDDLYDEDLYDDD